MNNCYTGTNVPPLEEETCDGIYSSTNCVIHQGAITYLNLPANSSVATIIGAFILNQMYQDELIAQLTTRIENLENV